MYNLKKEDKKVFLFSFTIFLRLNIIQYKQIHNSLHHNTILRNLVSLGSLGAPDKLPTILNAPGVEPIHMQGQSEREHERHGEVGS